MTSIIPESALNQHIAVLGKTRSGKTNSAKLVIEQVAGAGSRVCVIDPIKSDYWGLTSSADGKRAGLPFHIVGGSHGHVPLHAGAGAAIAEVVASGALRLSIIDMEAFGPRESGPFFAAFMETIFRRIQGVLYLVVDEAHLFAPKEGRGGDESMATYWFKRMASGSGSKGVRLIVSTQRVQELHNTVLSNCDTVIAHRVTFPEDQKRIAAWVASHASKTVVDEVKRSLPNLARGEAWICSGEAEIFERRQLPLCSTYDNSRTPTEDDQRRDVKTAAIDRDALRTIIGEAVKEAEANDPKLLRAKIADLSNQLYKSAKSVQTDPKIIEKAVTQAIAVRDREWTDQIRQASLKLVTAERTASQITGLVAGLNFDVIRQNLQPLNGHTGPSPKTTTGDTRGSGSVTAPSRTPKARVLTNALTHLAKSPVAAPAQRPGSSACSDGTGNSLGKGAIRRILIALAQHPDGLSYRKIGVFSGVSTKGGSFSTYLSRARQSGWVEGSDSEGVRITEAGLAALGSFEPLPIGRELGEYWLRELGDGAVSRILRVLIDAYPYALTHDEIGERAEVSTKGGSFSTYLSRLRSRELIEGSKSIRASEDLF